MSVVTTVVFTDADGDEFPIALEGWKPEREVSRVDGGGGRFNEAVSAAEEKLAEFEAAGDLLPARPIKSARVAA